MGEEKKEEVNKDEPKEEKKEELKQEEKKEDKHEEEAAEEIVLKVDMHCEACARKVVKVLKEFQGVEEVRADYKASRVVVNGKGKNSADPIKVSQRIQKKTGRNVVILSPLPKPQNDAIDLDTRQLESQQQPKQDEKKPEPPAAITVVLNVQMHCEACAQAMQKKIRKIKGVESVATDIGSNQVVVKGVVDPDKLVNDVYKKTRKHVTIVKNEEKKEEEKKESEENKDDKQDDKKQDEEGKEEDAKMDIKKIEYWPPKPYYMEFTCAPQMFSDENPNACSVM